MVLVKLKIYKKIRRPSVFNTSARESISAPSMFSNESVCHQQCRVSCGRSHTQRLLLFLKEFIPGGDIQGRDLPNDLISTEDECFTERQGLDVNFPNDK